MANAMEQRIIDVTKEIIGDYELVKPRLFLRLANRDRPVVNNVPADIPANKPVIMPGFCDLCTIASVRLTDEATLLVSEQLLEKWGIESDELYSDALTNSRIMLPPLIKTLGRVLNDLGFYDENLDNPDIEMLIVTNTKMHFGASAILYSDLPKRFYMLPSSIHELIILPTEGDKNPEFTKQLKELVKFVNDTEVTERERLSYSVYYNDRGKWMVME